nr:pyrimidine reductase family protein [Motilibacter aurantiacus]
MLPLPAQDGLGPDALLAAYACPPGPWVRANMVASLDGAATADGRSGGLSGPADKRVFRVLRALADVVLVGAGTARAEGYAAVQPHETYPEARAAAGRPPTAAIAVVTRRLDLDLSSGLFAGPARTVVLTCAAAGQDRLAAARAVADVAVVGETTVDVPEALSALRARGLDHVLCEGGPSLLRDVAACGRLDELCLTLSPQLRAGGAARVLVGPALEPPPRMVVVSVLEEDGDLFLRFQAAPGASEPGSTGPSVAG